MVFSDQITPADIIQLAFVAAAILISVGITRNDRKTIKDRLLLLEGIANKSSEVLVRLAALDEWKRQTEYRLGKVEDARRRQTG